MNVIAALKMIMESSLIPTSASFISLLAREYDDDKPAICRIQLRSMFIYYFMTGICLPMVFTVIIDEACWRYYLEFTPSTLSLMESWGMSMMGPDAWSYGMCARRAFMLYSPVWATQFVFQALLSPAIVLLRSFGPIRAFVGIMADFCSSDWGLPRVGKINSTDSRASRKAKTQHMKRVLEAKKARLAALGDNPNEDDQPEPSVADPDAVALATMEEVSKLFTMLATCFCFGEYARC